MNTNHEHSSSPQSPFGDVVYACTRAQAIADGVQVEVTTTAQEAGIRFPMFLTRTVYDAFVTVPPSVTAQDEAGRLNTSRRSGPTGGVPRLTHESAGVLYSLRFRDGAPTPNV